MKIFSSLLFLALTFAPPSFAEPEKSEYSEAIEKLLASEYRPSPLDILEAFDGVLPAVNPFIGVKDRLDTVEGGFATLGTTKILARAVSKKMPYAIAVFEKTYPNALYFPMGRDAAYFADALDFFYLSAGKGTRVHRLRGSGPTIRALSAKTGAEFLISNHFGVELNRPHILIDNTSFSDSSQSRILFRYGRTLLSNGGIPRNEHYKYLAVSAPGGWYTTKNDNENERLKKEVFSESTLSFNNPNNYYDNTLLYTGGFWHPSASGKLKTLPNGELAGVFKESFPESARLVTLGFIYEVMKVVSTPEFLKSVNSELKKLGAEPAFELENMIELEIEEITAEQKEELVNERIARQKARFKTLLRAELTRRLVPTTGNASYSSIKADWLSLLNEEEFAELETKYNELILASSGKPIVMNLLKSEFNKIIPEQLSSNKKLEFIISRLKKLDENELSKNNKLSANGNIVYKWTDFYSFLRWQGYTNSLSTIDLITALKIISEAYIDNRLSDRDFAQLSNDLLSYMQSNKRDYKKLKTVMPDSPEMILAFKKAKDFYDLYLVYFNNFLREIRKARYFTGQKSCAEYLRSIFFDNFSSRVTE